MRSHPSSLLSVGSILRGFVAIVVFDDSLFTQVGPGRSPYFALLQIVAANLLSLLHAFFRLRVTALPGAGTPGLFDGLFKLGHVVLGAFARGLFQRVPPLHLFGLGL